MGFLGPYLHQKTQGTTSDYFADVGYFTDGTSIIAAGNANNHPITAEDPHTNGSPLVASTYMACWLFCGWHIDDQGRERQQPSHHSNRSPHQRFPFAIFEVCGGGWLFCGWHRCDEGRQHEQPMSNGTRVDLQSWCRFQNKKK